MSDAIVASVTKSNGRKFLFHFTRVSNLRAIAHVDTLWSSNQINPHVTGDRRLKAMQVTYQNLSITINAHLRIPDSMIDASTSQEQFREYLDRHVFFWHTVKDCQKMLYTYKRRESDERFAVLELDAYSLLSDHYSDVLLSKYDSGSSPRFPTRCLYKKSLDMFVPFHEFKLVSNHYVPTKPSEIREILVEDQVHQVSKYLRSVYIEHPEDIPERWKSLMRPLADLQNMSAR